MCCQVSAFRGGGISPGVHTLASKSVVVHAVSVPGFTEPDAPGYNFQEALPRLGADSMALQAASVSRAASPGAEPEWNGSLFCFGLWAIRKNPHAEAGLAVVATSLLWGRPRGTGCAQAVGDAADAAQRAEHVALATALRAMAVATEAAMQLLRRMSEGCDSRVYYLRVRRWAHIPTRDGRWE